MGKNDVLKTNTDAERKNVDIQNKGGRKENNNPITLNVITLIVGIIVAICFFCWHMYHEKEQSSETDSNVLEEDSYNNTDDYVDGFWAARTYMELRKDVVILYKGDAITYEQLDHYAESYLSLLTLSLSNSEISTNDIENYNNIIKEIGLNYDNYELKSTESYIKGFRDYIQQNCYRQVIDYYHDLNQIPDEKYQAFQVICNNNLIPDEEHLVKIFNYARDVIGSCIGDADEVILSTEWRIYTCVEDFLSKPFD